MKAKQPTNFEECRERLLEVTELFSLECDEHHLTGRELEGALERSERLEGMLKNLLARIHRDGGQYVEKVGLEKAVEDADALVVALHYLVRENDASAALACAWKERDAAFEELTRLKRELP